MYPFLLPQIRNQFLLHLIIISIPPLFLFLFPLQLQLQLLLLLLLQLQLQTPTPTPRTQKPNSNSLLTFVKLFVASSHGTLPSSPTKQDIEFLNCCRFVAYALNNRSISNLRSTFGEFARSKYYYSPLLVRTAALKRMLKVRDYFGTPEIMSIYSNPCCLRTKPTTEENTIQRQVVYAVCKNTYNEFDFRVLKSFIKEGNVVNKYSKQTTC